MNRLKTWSLRIFFGLLAYMPLHILLSTWVGSSFDLLEIMKVAKDIVLVIGFAMLLVVTPLSVYRALLRSGIVRLILLYALLTLGLTLVQPTDQDAELLGLVYNTRFLLFFLYGMGLTAHFKANWLVRRSVQVVLGTSVIVMLFGILQYTLLSDTALTHLGYTRENGVLPVFLIDDKPGLERIMSTLRDPNSYGSYLIIVGSLCAGLWAWSKNTALHKVLVGVFALSVLNLLLTFSRSAWIGFFLAVLVVIYYSPLKARITQLLRRYLWLVLGVTVLAVSVLAATWNTYTVQNLVFHADESTVLEDPNELRARFFEESVDAIAEQPLGYGPGTAGLASIRNDDQTILNENYYLQIAHEVGVIGLTLFVAITVMLGVQLYRARKNPYALALFAALIGLSFTNTLVHIWSNEAVAYTFWGLASLAASNASRKESL